MVDRAGTYRIGRDIRGQENPRVDGKIIFK
jgi:hypothetical protein